MTDPSKDNRDTVKDLIDELRSERELRLVERREDALIVLVVQDRARAQMTAGFLGAARDVAVRVTFIAAGIETDLSGTAQGGTLSTGGAWKRAAGKVASQVNDWVKENRARLTALTN